MSALVSVAIVTYNSAHYIRHCLRYVLEQAYAPLEILIVDNASSDETPQILREFESRATVVYNRTNSGFAGGQNQAIAMSRGDWILTLNPDVRLTPDFISALVAAGEIDGSIGTVCGKLLSMPPDFEVPSQSILDSTGIFFTPSLRHFDRGSQELDLGQYEQFEYVFGATGAAALYRRPMIENVALGGDFFDSDFFAYREDADVAWRAQLLGWTCLYAPTAVAYHVRNVLPSNRRHVSKAINMHSVKNRFLMRIKNVTREVYRAHFLAITFRDLLVLVACLLREWSSLRAFSIVLRLLPRAWSKRREIMRRRKAGSAAITRWFSTEPVSFPVPLMHRQQLEAKARVTSN